MAHELDFSKGKAAIAYNGDMPWHRHGEQQPDGVVWSIDEWIEKAGLDYEVNAVPSQYMFNDELRTVPNRVQLVRSDTGESLSEMSANTYKIRQPRDILEGFESLLAGGAYAMEVAGALKGGRVVWALAKRVDAAGTIGADIIKPYITLFDSYDGTLATSGRLTSVRVVCANTLGYSRYCDGLTTSRQKHSETFNPDKLFADLAKHDEAFGKYMETMRALAKVKMTDASLGRFFSRIYAPEIFVDADKWTKSSMDSDKTTTNAKNVIADLLRLAGDNPGSNLPSADGTLYGALQTVTYYQDHEARSKNDKRWESATLGNGNRVKDEALDVAVTLLG